MLTCRDLTELVTDYLEGHLSIRQRLRFEMHVGLCRDCREYLRQMKHTIGRLESLRDNVIPEPVPQQLLARFREWKK